MCGIAGISFAPGHESDEIEGALNKNNLRPTLMATRDAIVHRGPDDSGLYIDDSFGVGLVHTRLSILEVSRLGHQPMISDNGQVVLVFNGEIYNFRELRAGLKEKGYSFCGHSDTEVLLKLYLAQSNSVDGLSEMLRSLNGIFAFALWDSRNGTLLLARDGLGVKPLYYAASAKQFVFASEIKALLPLFPSSCELDVMSLHRYLGFLWCPGDGTPIKSVRKLEPGQAMLVKQGRIERHWSWYRLPGFNTTRLKLDESDSVLGTVSHLRQAVHRQMVADVPVGAFLSGGLDSSAVVAFAREINPEIRCFTIEMNGGNEEGATDDLPYARRVAEHLDVPLDVVSIDAGQMAQDLERMVIQLDEPLADPASLNVLYISELARKHGIKVLLSGAGGDDLFTGYSRHYALLLEKWWRWLPERIRAGLDKVTSRLDQRRPLGRRTAKLFNGADLNGDVSIANYFMWARDTELMSLYTPEVKARLSESLAWEPLIDFLGPAPARLPRLERMLLLEQRFFLADHNLIYTDKMSMAAGVEVRVPFLDIDLVEFASRIPSEFKQNGATGKWVLKKAMESYLPNEVIYRPKSGFGAPLRRWMRYELRELLGDLLSEESLKRRGLFDPSRVHGLIVANDSGRVDASYTLLSLICIEIWCRHFVDRRWRQNA